MSNLSLMLSNIDLLVVGISGSAIALMGFIVFLNDRKSVTAQSFFVFALMTIAWTVSNLIQYKFATIPTTLFAMRLNLFLASLHALSFFQLSLVFPSDSFKYPRWYLHAVVPFSLLTAILTLTPFVFTGITALAPIGEVTNPSRGPGIVLFGLLTLGLLFSGLVLLFRKIGEAKDSTEKKQLWYIFVGMALTAFLILAFSMILPLFFNNLAYLPFSALSLLPFIGLVSYTIYKHRLFNMKIVGVQTLAFVLGILTFFEVLTTEDLLTLLFRCALLIAIVATGVLLTRSVMREVEQREEIEKLSTEKSEFMTFASHEIRNPLTAMRGYASLITDGTLGDVPPPVKDTAQKILVLGNEVLLLISEFLNKSKLELGMISYTVSEFELGEAVSAVVEGYRPHTDQKGLVLMSDINQNEHLKIKADLARVKEVVGNVIDNSLKYTPRGSITVSAHRHGVHARITIADTGVGIPPETMPHLFKKFSRADAAKVNILGTGIGLYLSKTITEAMGGRIWAESDGKDKGSRFILEFPLV
jgi:signal transduction histidine kinase